MTNEIKVFGTGWCPDVRRTRGHLDSLGVAYTFIDIDSDAAGERQVLEWNQGRRRVPTLELSVGEERLILSAPSNRELDEELKRLGAG